MQEAQELIHVILHSREKAHFLEAVDGLARKLAGGISEIKLQYRMALVHHDDHFAKKAYFAIFWGMQPDDKLAAMKSAQIAPWHKQPLQDGAATEKELEASAHGALPTPKEFSQALADGRRNDAMRLLFTLKKEYEIRLGFLHNYTHLLSAVLVFKELSQRNGFGNFRLPARNGHGSPLLAESVAKSCISIIKYWTDNEELPKAALGALGAVAGSAMLGREQAHSMLAAVEFARKQGIAGSGEAEWAGIVGKYNSVYGLDFGKIAQEASKLNSARTEYLGKAPRRKHDGELMRPAPDRTIFAMAKKVPHPRY